MLVYATAKVRCLLITVRADDGGKTPSAEGVVANAGGSDTTATVARRCGPTARAASAPNATGSLRRPSRRHAGPFAFTEVSATQESSKLLMFGVLLGDIKPRGDGMKFLGRP